MGNCGECRFWGDADDKGKKYRKCQGVKHADDSERWGREDNPSYYDEVSRKTVPITTSAHVIDGSGYYAALKCREDFGCALWEANHVEG